MTMAQFELHDFMTSWTPVGPILPSSCTSQECYWRKMITSNVQNTEVSNYRVSKEICSVLFLIVSWPKIWAAIPRQCTEQSCIPRVSPFTDPGKALVTQWDTDRSVFSNWSAQKLQKLQKTPDKTAANRQQNVSAWTGDLCLIPSREKYPHLGTSCPLTSVEKFPLALCGPGCQQLCCIKKILFNGTSTASLNAEKDCNWSETQDAATFEVKRTSNSWTCNASWISRYLVLSSKKSSHTVLYQCLSLLNLQIT